MADTSGRSPRPRTGRERIKTLTQAALNADGVPSAKDVNALITRIDELAPRLIGVVERLEVIVERVEKIVGLGEQVMAPWTATENAVRGAVNAVRKSTGL